MPETKHKVCPITLAGGLNNWFRRLFQNPHRILEPYIHEGMTALDFGCGPGFFTLDMAHLVGPSGRVVAADLQSGVLEKVHTKIQDTILESRISLHKCKPDEIGLSQTVDFALAFYMVHELSDRLAFFSEIHQRLSPKGLLFIVEPPFHVSLSEFETTLRIAQEVGFMVSSRPHVSLSKSAILKKC